MQGTRHSRRRAIGVVEIFMGLERGDQEEGRREKEGIYHGIEEESTGEEKGELPWVS